MLFRSLITAPCDQCETLRGVTVNCIDIIAVCSDKIATLSKISVNSGQSANACQQAFYAKYYFPVNVCLKIS